LLPSGAGIGGLVAEWVSLQSNTHLLLLGRGGHLSPTAAAILQTDAVIVGLRCDISMTSDISSAMLLDASNTAQLAGLVHSGGVLQDSALLTQSVGSVRKVYAPKLQYMLRTATTAPRQALATVHVLSSIAALLGTPGQSNYAGANMALNAWTGSLRQQGVTGT
jgi:short-subunit dehydrogenase